MADWINQSVPQPGVPGAVDPKQLAMLQYLTDDDQEEAARQQALVEQLRNYKGGDMPQMRGKYAPEPLEYAATLANRLTSIGGQAGAMTSEGNALEALFRKLYGGGSPAAAPGAGSYKAMDTGNYGGGI